MFATLSKMYWFTDFTQHGTAHKCRDADKVKFPLAENEISSLVWFITKERSQ